MSYTREQINSMFEKLPIEIQDSMESKETIEFLKQTEKKYNLSLEQTQELSAEIGLLMLGASSPQHFIESLEKMMKIPKETAKTIALEVNEKIFRLIKEPLKTLHLLNKKEETHKVNIIPSEPLTKKESASVKNFGEMKEESKVETVDPYRESV
ncbi:MAG: hypothetical protein NT098_05890 [Candidatus Parcubacteria bacterium]|nr:hypothetical protein [Candidatus Parcubacteria bacterium]